MAGGWTQTGIVVLVNLTLTTEPAPPKPKLTLSIFNLLDCDYFSFQDSTGRGKPEAPKKVRKSSPVRPKPKPKPPKPGRKIPKKKKVEYLTQGVTDMSTKFDQLLSAGGQTSPVTFESTDDAQSTSSSSDDFFTPATKKFDNQRLSPTKSSSEKLYSSPSKRAIEKIINSKSLSGFDDDDDDEARTNVGSDAANVVDPRLSDKTYESKTRDFSESDDSDDDDDNGSSKKLKLNQGIKNQILKNCFASLAARHT